VTKPWHLETLEIADRQLAPLEYITNVSAEVPEKAAHSFKGLGLELLPRNATDAAALLRAGLLIALIPDLWFIITNRVNNIAIVHSIDDCYDTSHSDPSWPGLILVSIPRATPVGDLRLAEAIIHEAMHHHLSALEQIVPLVTSGQTIYSPWKCVERPAIGILHGIYVFGCVSHAFMRLIELGDLHADQLKHAQMRIEEIREEFEAIDHRSLYSSLTSSGKQVLDSAAGELMN